MLFYDCSTLSVVGQFPGLGTMFGESFKPVSLVPLVMAFLVLAGFAAAVKMDGKHEYYKHLSSVFFVDTPKPEKVAMMAKLSATFASTADATKTASATAAARMHWVR